jgi:hypothetical protein
MKPFYRVAGIDVHKSMRAVSDFARRVLRRDNRKGGMEFCAGGPVILSRVQVDTTYAWPSGEAAESFRVGG